MFRPTFSFCFYIPLRKPQQLNDNLKLNDMAAKEESQEMYFTENFDEDEENK